MFNQPLLRVLAAALCLPLCAGPLVASPTEPDVDPTAIFRPGSEPTPAGAPGPGSTGLTPRGAPCAANAGNCQELTGTTIADPRTSDLVGGGFTVSDNFQPSITGNLTSLCFTGYYGAGVPAGANVPAAGAEAFRITIWENNGTGLPGTQVTQIFVGANAAAQFGAVTYTGTLARGTSLGTPSSFPGTTLFAWTVSGLAIPVTAGTCYWMEIAGATNAVDTNSRWRWVNSTHATGAGSYADGVCLQTANGTTPTYSSIVNAFDRAFCLTMGASSNVLQVPACGIPSAPTNSTCATALAIGPGSANPLPYNAPAGTNTYRSTTAVTPYCGLSLVNGNTLWYRLVGDGTTISANTCGPATNFDTIISVYCLGSGVTACGTSNTNLMCVASNDTGHAACVGDNSANADPSSVSWVATNGATYYLAVHGFFGGAASIGALDLQVTSDGVQAAGPACVSDRCPVDLASITGVSEPDACTTTADTNNVCTLAGVQVFSLGSTLKGTVWATPPTNGAPGNGRDVDWWEYNTATPLPDNSGGAGFSYLNLSWRTESPLVMALYVGTCTTASPGANTVAFVGRYRPSSNGVLSDGVCGPLAAVVQGTANSPFRILVSTPDFGGLPCQTGWNNYALTITQAPSGACCVTGVACQVTAVGFCTTQGGAYAGDNVTCTSLPCPGACCSNAGCALTNGATACSATGGTYQGEGSTCDIVQCPLPTGVCCRGATCNTIIAQAACNTTGWLAGSLYAAGPLCTGNTTAGCCHADYNKTGGIAVTDVFDYINDWFAASPYSNTGGDGSGGTLSTNNIFDFLNAWFGGCGS